MQTWISIGAAAAIVVATLATTANAGGLSIAGDAAAPADALVAEIGGSHRGCRWSDEEGWHRHIGSYDRSIGCEEQVQHRRASRRLHVEVPYGYEPYDEDDDGGGALSCRPDWHCERTGLFGLDKYCYWRQVCD